MLIALIIACEVGFWVVLLMGLCARYVLKKPRLGAYLLMCVPLVDLFLLVASALDLHRGAQADFAHGLAAAYLGFTVAFGHDLIRWADEKVAQRYAGASKPEKHERFGWEYAKYEWLSWLKGVIASLIAAFLLLVAIWYVDDASRTEALVDWFSILAGIMGIWFVFGPLCYTFLHKKKVS